jgi:hypothetical protein
MKHSMLLLTFLLVFPSTCLAWRNFDETEGPLHVAIDEIPTVTDRDAQVPVSLQITNEGKSAVTGEAEIRDLVDAWRITGKSKQSFRVAAGETIHLSFAIHAGKGLLYSVLYPAHAYVSFKDETGQTRVIHVVRIFKATPNQGSCSQQLSSHIDYNLAF